MSWIAGALELENPGLLRSGQQLLLSVYASDS
jgi:hypothetical protein